jgi:hypothetical protein
LRARRRASHTPRTVLSVTAIAVNTKEFQTVCRKTSFPRTSR